MLGSELVYEAGDVLQNFKIHLAISQEILRVLIVQLLDFNHEFVEARARRYCGSSNLLHNRVEALS